MRSSAAAFVVLFAAALGRPAPLSAQEPVKSFDQLDTRLKPGDTIWVIDAQGRELKGHVLALTPDSLVLYTGRRRTFTSGDVRAVRERDGPVLGKAALWGAVAGAGAGLLLAVTNRAEFASDSCPPDAGADCWPPPGTKPPIDWWPVPIMGGLGAGLGTLVGALLPGKTRDVYRAPPAVPGAGPGARMSVAPILAPRRKAVVVSIAF
jgi:hypothetical protein